MNKKEILNKLGLDKFNKWTILGVDWYSNDKIFVLTLINKRWNTTNSFYYEATKIDEDKLNILMDLYI